jgi:DnaK suppressor protein
VDTDHAREVLARERQRIEQALARLAPEEDDELSHVDQHLADEGTELTQRETDEGLAEQLQEQLAAVERAEARLREGTYGISIESGESIPDARLERVPWAERTAEEQGRYERGG